MTTSQIIPIKITRNNALPIPKPQNSFHFVDQGNYLKKILSSNIYLYSDSATSCIITIIVGTKNGVNTATLAHLDSPACIQAFMNTVSAAAYDSIQIFAQGANPPGNQTAYQNEQQLVKSVKSLGNAVIKQQFFLLEGNPRDANRGHFGIHCDAAGIITVSNQPYELELTDRDPSCGGQTVYCIMRRHETTPLEIRDASVPFSHAELIELSEIALAYTKVSGDPSTAFTNIVNMESDDILDAWSTTPQYEAPWFSDQLKQGACFALAMAPVVSLSAYQLKKAGNTSFGRLKKSLLGA